MKGYDSTDKWEINPNKAREGVAQVKTFCKRENK